MDHLNHDVLDALRETLGDSDFFEVLNTFTQQFQQQLQALIQHAGRQELSECARILHSLKGGAGNIGADKLAEIANALEQQLREGDLRELPDRLDALANTTWETIDQLRASGYLSASP